MLRSCKIEGKVGGKVILKAYETIKYHMEHNTDTKGVSRNMENVDDSPSAGCWKFT